MSCTTIGKKIKPTVHVSGICGVVFRRKETRFAIVSNSFIMSSAGLLGPPQQGEAPLWEPRGLIKSERIAKSSPSKTSSINAYSLSSTP